MLSVTEAKLSNTLTPKFAKEAYLTLLPVILPVG